MKIIKKIFHDWLGWGSPGKLIESTGYAYPLYTCKHCDGRLSQDSQGNWFHLDI